MRTAQLRNRIPILATLPSGSFIATRLAINVYSFKYIRWPLSQPQPKENIPKHTVSKAVLDLTILFLML